MDAVGAGSFNCSHVVNVVTKYEIMEVIAAGGEQLLDGSDRGL